MKPGSILFALAALTACATPVVEMPPPARTPPAPVETPVRGTLSASESGYSLTPCDSNTAQPLEDATAGDLEKVQSILEAGSRGVYIEGALVDGKLVRISRASPAEMNRCEETWNGVTLRARGNEPFWALDVTDTELQWKTPDSEATLGIADSSVDTNALAWKGVAGDQTMEAQATRTRCVDSMSGEVLPWTVQVSFDSQEFHGCASRPPGS